MADCLRNAVVVRKILEHFSNAELLELSFVNKFWNYEARSVIRNRGNIIARLDRNGQCHNIQTFAAYVRHLKMVPFCGIRMILRDKDETCEGETSVLEITDDVIVLDPQPFKYLSVQLPEKQWSPGFLLAKKILQVVSGVLEEFTLQVPFAEETFISDYVQECSFPRLRILKLKETHRYHVTDKDFVNHLKVLISRAPSLTELHSDRPPKVLLDLVEGSSVVPMCSYEISSPFDDISMNVINGPLRLQRIKLVFLNGPHGFDFDRFNRVCPMLLQSSSTRTLCDVTVDPVLAVPLMCYGICLENVTKLTMAISYYEMMLNNHHLVLRFVKGFDFTRIFPNLTKVHISHGGVPGPLPVSLKKFIREANVSNSMPDRAVNIKELHLLQDGVLTRGCGVSQYFAEMFPSIQRLHVESRNYGENIFMLGTICENWVNLKELHIKSTALEDTKNFDCVLCGIYFDEVVQLMQKDEEYLKRVNIVPVKPSITCLRNLRVLNVEYDLKRRPDPIIYDATNPMFFLSKITGLIALAKCPKLAVTLKISPDGAPAVSHLKPYLTIVQ